ncbi:MAG TPA: SRPBCC domain-containing protein [Flavisolibacter sp.]|nr:SRPBCC domain-containing protein [Flavisolibacter sp.]
MKQEPLVMERWYGAPIEQVWQALTDTGQMKQWYFDMRGFSPVQGAEFTFEGENEGRKFIHLCKVTEVVPAKKLSHSWAYKGYEGSSHLTFELFEEQDGTRLTLTHVGLETFPQDNPDFRRENFHEGWTFIMDTSLKKFLKPAAAE